MQEGKTNEILVYTIINVFSGELFETSPMFMQPKSVRGYKCPHIIPNIFYCYFYFLVFSQEQTKAKGHH